MCYVCPHLYILAEHCGLCYQDIDDEEILEEAIRNFELGEC